MLSRLIFNKLIGNFMKQPSVNENKVAIVLAKAFSEMLPSIYTIKY